jgi:hypothetical protein
MWEFVVAGPPIDQMSDAANEAQSGELFLSTDALAILNAHYPGVAKTGGRFFFVFFLSAHANTSPLGLAWSSSHVTALRLRRPSVHRAVRHVHEGRVN